MSIPAHFDESRPDVLHDFIRRHPFGMLVTHGAAGLDANHLPFELDPSAGEKGVLTAHVARANPVWQELSSGCEVLVVFRAGDAYISPNWYLSKQETHKQVPTWNYMVVHAHGRVTVRDDERFVRGVIGRLTRTHEAAQPQPWKMADAPKDYLEQMLKAIVGLEIEITRIEGKYKLSQNKDVKDISSAAEALQAQGELLVSTAMLAAAKHGR